MVGAAVKLVVAAEARHRVVAAIAPELVGERVARGRALAVEAGQAVGLVRADHPVDAAAVHVIGRIAARHLAGRQVHRHALGRVGIVDVVLAGAADESVRARTAHEAVVARAARQRVVARTAHQRVVARLALQVVVAVPAREAVLAIAAIDRVVALAGQDRVVAAIGVNDVIVRLGDAQDGVVVVDAVALGIAGVIVVDQVVAGRALDVTVLRGDAFVAPVVIPAAIGTLGDTAGIDPALVAPEIHVVVAQRHSRSPTSPRAGIAAPQIGRRGRGADAALKLSFTKICATSIATPRSGGIPRVQVRERSSAPVPPHRTRGPGAAVAGLSGWPVGGRVQQAIDPEGPCSRADLERKPDAFPAPTGATPLTDRPHGLAPQHGAWFCLRPVKLQRKRKLGRNRPIPGNRSAGRPGAPLGVVDCRFAGNTACCGLSRS